MRVTTGAREQIFFFPFFLLLLVVVVFLPFNFVVVVVVVVLFCFLSDLNIFLLVSWPGLIVSANIWDEPE